MTPAALLLELCDRHPNIATVKKTTAEGAYTFMLKGERDLSICTLPQGGFGKSTDDSELLLFLMRTLQAQGIVATISTDGTATIGMYSATNSKDYGLALLECYLKSNTFAAPKKRKS